MDKVYVGLDLGSSFFQQAALNQDGAVTMNRRFPTSEANLRGAFTGLRWEIQVHLEAGELAPGPRPSSRFKRTYQRALAATHDRTHARLTVQRKILSTMRAIWLTRTPYRDELSR